MCLFRDVPPRQRETLSSMICLARPLSDVSLILFFPTCRALLASKFTAVERSLQDYPESCQILRRQRSTQT